MAVKWFIKEVAAIDSEDGFSFTWFSAEELSQPHMEYIGYRIRLDAQFGKMHDKIQVDIGIGDAVEPVETTFSLFEYKGKPIFSGEFLCMYIHPKQFLQKS